MPKFGFVIDNRKCIGCHACTVACKSEHQVPIGVDRTWVKYIEKGSFPNNRRLFTVMRCNHCEWAPCVTICPVTALYTRADGVVDFNSDRCIGCKSCLQACPYDALYIDPNNDTAAKCNFCTHRLEIGLEPSCVVVCPEHAIIAGDMEDPLSEISQLLDRHPVQVRKPEKETKPKLFYIEADEASLVPTRTSADDRSLWSCGDRGIAPKGNGAAGDGSTRISLSVVSPDSAPRRVYDVRPRPPAWGWHVVAYTWTKSLATGSFLAIVAARLFSAQISFGESIMMALVSLVFLVATAGLLVADLKQPRRFLYVLLRPQWRSWLVRGAYLLSGFAAIVTAWLLASLAGATSLADLLLWPGGLLAVCSAVYTAFLFAQAKGRDFWQNPLLSMHLLAHCFLASGALWLIVDIPKAEGGAARVAMMGALTLSLITILAELLTTPPTADAHLALRWILHRPMGAWFWGVGVGVGHLLPMLVVLAGLSLMYPVAALAVLVGMYAIEHLWVLAPQQVPLS
jgi:Fe-S-cluster-containing dehydrogenase component